MGSVEVIDCGLGAGGRRRGGNAIGQDGGCEGRRTTLKAMEVYGHCEPRREVMLG